MKVFLLKKEQTTRRNVFATSITIALFVHLALFCIYSVCKKSCISVLAENLVL